MDEQLEFTLSGRLRNIVLAPNAKNALVPLFEAITNSLHAIEDRFGPEHLDRGRIDIGIERAGGQPIASYRVDDNGEGLTPENYKSFITSDSVRKVARGGKGVGRLTWLKVFGQIDIDSYYDEGGVVHRLSFSFLPDDTAPIKNKKIEAADPGAPIGTSVRMEAMHGAFQARSPQRKGTIADEIVRHFIAYLVAPNSPTFNIYDYDDHVDLSEYFKERISENSKENIQVKLDESHIIELEIHHLLVDRKLRDSDIGYNTVYLNAHGRNVDRYPIDTAIGLQVLRGDSVYMAVVSSPYFDEYVAQERTYLAVAPEDMEKIRRHILEAAKGFLHYDIGLVRAEQRDKAKRAVDSNPRFMSVVGDLDEFMESKIPLSMTNEEEIHLAFEREYRRERNRQAREYLSARQSKNEGHIKNRLEKYVGFLTEDIQYALAEYIIRRKAVLDAMLDAQGYEDADKKRHHLEELLHEYICPLRALSEDLNYEAHNLWVIDDRLAFYNYFASDKPIKTFQPESSDRREPDLALFDLGLGLRREGSDQPVVIVEFKRPGREAYSDERPVEQVLRYVKSLRENGSIKNKDGRVIATLNQHTSFIGYIVADLTTGLRETLMGSIVNRPTADGFGLWGFEENLRTYIEIIPYDKLFRDARARNEVFFSKLRLQS